MTGVLEEAIDLAGKIKITPQNHLDQLEQELLVIRTWPCNKSGGKMKLFSLSITCILDQRINIQTDFYVLKKVKDRHDYRYQEL